MGQSQRGEVEAEDEEGLPDKEPPLGAWPGGLVSTPPAHFRGGLVSNSKLKNPMSEK